MVNPITPKLTPVQVKELLRVAANNDGTINAGKLTAAIDGLKDKFGKKLGDNNGKIDTNQELAILAQILSTKITGEKPNELEQLEKIQRLILVNLNTLVNGDEISRVKNNIISSWRVNNYYSRMASANAKPSIIQRILQSQDGWYMKNVGTVINIGQARREEALKKIDKAGEQLLDNDKKLAGLEGWKKNLRRSLYGAWNNDGPGVQFLSCDELAAIYMRAKAECKKEKGKDFDETKFKEEFNETYIKGIEEDIKFNPNLLAYQFGQSLSCCMYKGDGSKEFLSLFQDLHKSVCKKAAENLPPGTILYAIKKVNPSHGQMIVYVDKKKGEVTVDWTSPQQGVVFDFDGKEMPVAANRPNVKPAGFGRPGLVRQQRLQLPPAPRKQ